MNVQVNETAVSQSAINALGPIANGVIANGFFLPQAEHSAAEATIQASMAKYAPKGTALSSFHWLPWEDVYYLAELAKKVLAAHEALTSSNINKMISSTVMSYGISPPVVFSKPGPIAGAPRLYNTSIYFEKVINETLEPWPNDKPVNAAPALAKYHVGATTTGSIPSSDLS